MLGKIWGIVLLVLGAYVAYEVMSLPDAPPRQSAKPSPVTSSPADENPPDPTPADIEEAAAAANVPVRYDEKSDAEVSESVTQVCEEMESELRDAKISPAFAKIRIRYREARLQTPLLKNLVANCFRKLDSAASSLEIEVFSSEFGGEARNQIQLQVSVFDKDFRNKTYEVGRRFETVKMSLDRPASVPED